MNINAKPLIAYLAATVCIVVAGYYFIRESAEPIQVGVLFSQSGNMATSEEGMADIIEMAVAELNSQGGLLGRQIETVIRDGRSDPEVFVSEAKSLVEKENVDVVFGCWTSSCRKSVRPVFEENNHLLYYPVQYEGLENSKNIIYLGSVPNQQVTPAIEWVLSRLGKRIYLVGSDYVYPRASNLIISDQVQQWRGEIVGEKYLPLGAQNFSGIVEDIKKAKPDVIFNTVNGVSNAHFFKALRDGGVNASDVPTFSFSLSESEIVAYRDVSMAGDFVVLNYIGNSPDAINQSFVQRFRSHSKGKQVMSEGMALAYLGVKLWAKAVVAANSSKPAALSSVASDLSIHGPSGMLYIEKATQHVWKSMHIAEINEQHQLRSVWHSKVPIPPIPYPSNRTRVEWDQYLAELQRGWGGLWQASSPHAD